MKILFLGDVVGISGCSKLMNNLMNEIKSKNIDFVIKWRKCSFTGSWFDKGNM